MSTPPDDASTTSAINQQARQGALALFRRSVLKQEKFRAIEALLGDTRGKTCLDVGSNNGVISYLLRQRGGLWFSADLEPKTVESIRAMVGERVWRIDDQGTPFEDGAFDLVVIIDFLEHIAGDGRFVRELTRILKPGGELVVNVPNLKPASLLNKIRLAIGLTDEKHGHLRPGYSADSLATLLGPDFKMERSRTYSKTFSESVDTLLNFLYMTRQEKKDRQVGSAKGIVVGQEELGRNKKEFYLLSALYPLLYLVAKLDHLLPFFSGYKLIIKARFHPSGHRA
jgi:SAM-dependent methyltransferase